MFFGFSLAVQLTFSKNKIENAVTSRMKAQSDKNHYQAKLQAEQRKVDEAEAQVKVLTEEFIVRLLKRASCCLTYLCYVRTGPHERKNTANA